MTTMVASKPYHLTEQQVADYDRDGFLVLRNWVTGDLLTRLQTAGARWIEDGITAGSSSPDYAFAKREIGEVFFRVDYLHDKGETASLELLGSPQVLGVVESLQGSNFVPTYESMVFKQAGDGEAIRWHQDAVTGRGHRVFNYDLYLDESRSDAGALVVIPGSQHVPADMCQLEQQHGWTPPGAISVEMNPGDVLIHDVMVVHGSARTIGKAQRRTIYYEFRSVEQIRAEGPWDEEWITKRMRMLPLGLRAYAERYPDALQFEWNPDPSLRQTVSASNEEELRIVHTAHTPGSYCSATSV